jgi:hypothetical protein
MPVLELNQLVVSVNENFEEVAAAYAHLYLKHKMQTRETVDANRRGFDILTILGVRCRQYYHVTTVAATERLPTDRCRGFK